MYGGIVQPWGGKWTSVLFDDACCDGFRRRVDAKRWVECELARRSQEASCFQELSGS